jgi:glycine/D-amino acid oxidase-like deaminating enzyme
MPSPEVLFALCAGAGVLAAPGVVGALFGKKGVESGQIRTEALWTTEMPPIAPLPKLDGDRKVDLAIIGGGYTGLSCAYYAKKHRPDWSVAVLESHRLGSGASSRNSGAVYARYWGLADQEMPQRGFDRLARFIEEEEIECDFRPAPTLELYASKRSARKAEASPEPDSKWVSAGKLRSGAGTSYYAGAAELPIYHTVHPAKLVAGHVKAALRMEVELCESSPVLRIRSGKPAVLETPGGSVQADQVVLATNAYTPRLGCLKTSMVPVHQYTFATRRLSDEQISAHGLDRWPLRFERSILPVTNFLTPSGHLCIRIVLGYASFNSCVWQDIEGARNLAKKMFEQRYPWIADVGLEQGWHGVTGHTLRVREITGPVMGENVHAAVGFNGLGIMPGHNTAYLSACRITGHADQDMRYMLGKRAQIPIPGELYRSMLLKPAMKALTPV